MSRLTDMVEPRERTRVPLCRWNFNKNEFVSVGNLIYFESEDDLILSRFFATLSSEEKIEIFSKVASAPARGEIPSMTLKEEIKKKYDERKEKNMFFTNTTGDTINLGTCFQSHSITTTSKQVKPDIDYSSVFRCYASEPREGLFSGNPAINGVAFGPNDEVYLTICGRRCEIYPNDDSGMGEVELIRNLDIQEFMKNYREKSKKTIPGGKINRLQKALAKWRRMLTPFSTKQFKGPAFNKIIFSGRTTILLGDKNDKTVVKCMDGEPYDPEKALLTALFIREYGKNTYHDLMDICHEEYEKCGEPGIPYDHSSVPSSASMTKSAADTIQAFVDFAKKIN